MSVAKYKRLHVNWMQDRAEGLLPAEEARWMEKMETVLDEINEADQAVLEAWIEEQKVYRREHDMPECSVELTPGEKDAVLWSGKFDLIIAEDDDFVVLDVSGRELKISTGVLLDIDEEESLFWLSTEDAEKLGLSN